MATVWMSEDCSHLQTLWRRQRWLGPPFHGHWITGGAVGAVEAGDVEHLAAVAGDEPEGAVVEGLHAPALVGPAVPRPLDDAGAVGHGGAGHVEHLAAVAGNQAHVAVAQGSTDHRWLTPPLGGHTITPAPSAMETKATSRALPLWLTVMRSPVTGGGPAAGRGRRRGAGSGSGELQEEVWLAVESSQRAVASQLNSSYGGVQVTMRQAMAP